MFENESPEFYWPNAAKQQPQNDVQFLRLQNMLGYWVSLQLP